MRCPKMRLSTSNEWIFLKNDHFWQMLFFICSYSTCLSLQNLHHKKSFIGYTQCLMSYSHLATSYAESTIRRGCNGTSYHYMVLTIPTIHAKFFIKTMRFEFMISSWNFWFQTYYGMIFLYINISIWL